MRDWIVQLFLRLRQRGYLLGVAEYQAALDAVDAGFAIDEAALLDLVQVLWCHSRSQQSQLLPLWDDLQREARSRQEKDDLFKDHFDRDRTSDELLPQPMPERNPSKLLEREAEVETKQEMQSLPVQAPMVSPIEQDQLLSLQSYFPVSRRSMAYGWRFLRRMVGDGAMVVVDIAATVQRVTEQGYYLAPVYRRRQRNATRLLILVDQNGSMMPFHRFSRDLVETAREGSCLDAENVRVFYFQNVPGAYVYEDVYLTKPVKMAEVLESVELETSVLVVSDGGAARGYRRQERIQATTRFLLRLKRRSSLVAWLNPMRRERWEGSSAEILAYLVPMFAMDRLGFGEAIDVLRGAVVAVLGVEG